MDEINYMTQEGYDKLVAELDQLKTDGRANASKAIAEARDKGDLSENAEYDAAKNAQGMMELKINTMDKMLANARVLDQSTLDTSKVTILSDVTIKNVKTKKELTYKLVSKAESDLKSRKISIDSPMGAGLLGKEIGEIAVVESPRGNIEFEIMNISLS